MDAARALRRPGLRESASAPGRWRGGGARGGPVGHRWLGRGAMAGGRVATHRAGHRQRARRHRRADRRAGRAAGRQPSTRGRPATPADRAGAADAARRRPGGTPRCLRRDTADPGAERRRCVSVAGGGWRGAARDAVRLVVVRRGGGAGVRAVPARPGLSAGQPAPCRASPAPPAAAPAAWRRGSAPGARDGRHRHLARRHHAARAAPVRTDRRDVRPAAHATAHRGGSTTRIAHG